MSIFEWAKTEYEEMIKLLEKHNDPNAGYYRERMGMYKAAFSITSVSREDVACQCGQAVADAMVDFDMKNLAEDMGEDYVTQLFWTSMDLLVQKYVSEEVYEIGKRQVVLDDGYDPDEEKAEEEDHKEGCGCDQCMYARQDNMPLALARPMNPHSHGKEN